jgi:ZIP family zinc transporter
MLHALPILLAFTTVVSTFLGGLFAMRRRDRLHHILGFTAGVLLGVVAFDLLPEIFHLTQETMTKPIVPMIALVVGFLAFHVVEKLTIVHSGHEHAYERGHKHPYVGVMSGLALSFHSFFDGVGIGLAFQANTALGISVALAVIAHDFCDGLNTVTLMLVNANSPRKAIQLLVVDAVAPVLGAASTLLFTISDRWLLLYLGSFAGFLLYIGASDILPEAHAVHPSHFTLALTILGVVLVYFVATMGAH